MDCFVEALLGLCFMVFAFHSCSLLLLSVVLCFVCYVLVVAGGGWLFNFCV